MTGEHLQQVVLHVGAHKTATSHLQRSLNEVRPELAASGVQVYTPNHLRSAGASLAERLGLPGFAKSAPESVRAEGLVRLVRQGRRLVLSEENFVGTLYVARGRMEWPLYPRAVPRVETLIEALAPVPVSLCLGLRNPADFLSSVYSQMLMGGRLITAEAFRKRHPPERVDWVDYAKRLSGIAPLTVWKYEEYSAVFGQICEALLGRDAPQVPPVEARVHPGLTQDAVDAVLEGEEVQAARKRFPIGAGRPRFSTFTEDEIAAAGVFYDAQWDAIRALPGVRVVEGGNG